MKQEYIIRTGHQRLLLFFAGWGMDARPFRHYASQDNNRYFAAISPKGDNQLTDTVKNTPPGTTSNLLTDTAIRTAHDLLLCYDYRDLYFDSTVLNQYEAIDIAAWSMGVWAASRVIPLLPADITRRIGQSIAINGTPYPIDEARGIPPTLFQGTLDGLSEASYLKFIRRMCGSNTDFRHFREIAPCRPIEELREELSAIAGQYRKEQQVSDESGIAILWQQAIIGTSDRIFPPANQRSAWQGTTTRITEIEVAHYYESIPYEPCYNDENDKTNVSDESNE